MSEWLLFRERRPPEGQYVIISDGKKIGLACLKEGYLYPFEHELQRQVREQVKTNEWVNLSLEPAFSYIYEDDTHWMPLPAPPKESE